MKLYIISEGKWDSNANIAVVQEADLPEYKRRKMIELEQRIQKMLDKGKVDGRAIKHAFLPIEVHEQPRTLRASVGVILELDPPTSTGKMEYRETLEIETYITDFEMWDATKSLSFPYKKA